MKEFEQAFKTREKIVRSPPDGTGHPPMKQGQGGAPGGYGGNYYQGGAPQQRMANAGSMMRQNPSAAGNQFY